MTVTDNKDRNGVINAISAYLLWGLAPIYFKLISSISPDEIMVHRIIWSSLLLFLIVIISKRFRVLIDTLKQPRLLAKLALSATFLLVNWFLFIWAINNDHLLDASLGYFINPLFSVALGVIFLGERLRKMQKFAVALALCGVLIQLVALGSLPVISLALAGTFGIYGLLRKKMHLDSFVGLLIESSMMLPLAIVYWLLFVNTNTANMFENSSNLNLLLIAAGVVTTAPLLCFTAAAKRLTLSTLGFFQYIGPSIMFFLATFYYQETLQPAKLVTFAAIWLALVIYSLDSLKARNEKRKLALNEGLSR
ncbi:MULTISPECIES: EamA family transporter RarD [unclassified Colwellia]|jgi:chloramphenicol-sensitive protein RarD|uniref:EamA family transporter RarD n=1 Tax=unclassified Colwellia TaxID=196834 RepID=UPI0015F4FA07|nr:MULTISPECIES: EamA family transporter RarD [unclassified Colwellia]MBA6347841.1 EamA family transporter RarD [Colwellia sp. BRX8-9]MBA6351834.1 EamA family transporter RarD [Colwellia sp. BRX9-1]MBA6357015.1 EamA family transporter RarD [Colwellia sp. BRX8-3]MBA6360676.1 EamA family transporter RarD [Colwellia sp. BRX8-6]MBA6369026.1 EamA family transporter RarD [Colwellia sp. BRX8-5]|tara:strand:+ start:466 stop:1389 length:924 start_codon:yes stop_codon:yes gene_type:complete